MQNFCKLLIIVGLFPLRRISVASGKGGQVLLGYRWSGMDSLEEQRQP